MSTFTHMIWTWACVFKAVLRYFRSFNQCHRFFVTMWIKRMKWVCSLQNGITICHEADSLVSKSGGSKNVHIKITWYPPDILIPTIRKMHSLKSDSPHQCVPYKVLPGHNTHSTIHLTIEVYAQNNDRVILRTLPPSRTS